jgi:hypothetical protein
VGQVERWHAHTTRCSAFRASGERKKGGKGYYIFRALKTSSNGSNVGVTKSFHAGRAIAPMIF